MELGKQHNVLECIVGLGEMYEEGFWFAVDFSKAEENYFFAANQGSSYALAHLNSLAYRYAEGNGVTKDFDKALSLIERVIELSENKESYLDSKGEFYLMMGKIEDARLVWQQILHNSPGFYVEYMDKNNRDTPLNSYMVNHYKQNSKLL